MKLLLDKNLSCRIFGLIEDLFPGSEHVLNCDLDRSSDEGKSYSEIGTQIGMTKQGVHKITAAAMQSLREHLESQGFAGLDSVRLLKSFREE